MSSRKLKIIADENIPRNVIRWLHGQRRVDLQTVLEVGLRRRPDADIVDYATKNERIILAGDEGFSERNHVVCTHPGIINVSTFNVRPDASKKRLSQMIRKARRLVDHHVIHLRENDFCVVKRGNQKETFRYK